jgi:hypothetical protein
MPKPSVPRPRTAHHQLPITVWCPDPEELSVAPIPGAVLPAWAIDKVRTELVGRPAHQPAPLLKIAIRDTAPGMDARIPSTPFAETAGAEGAAKMPSLLLAELHPDALPAPTGQLPTAASGVPDTIEDGWSGFFHRAHRLLPDNGLLLMATRQRRQSEHLTDPLGTLVASARTAGFRYLQHIVIVYGRAVGNDLVPALPVEDARGVAHCDLVALSAIRHA